jgi:hypothetical protein
MSEAVDHAIVSGVSADDQEVLARLAALEAEVKAESEKKAAELARKREIIAELKRREDAKRAAAAPPPAAPKALPEPKPQPKAQAKPQPKPQPKRRDPELEDLDDGTAGIEMVVRGAKLATTAKKELARPREKGEKSWIASGLLSMFFGPVGWLYAGSFREAIPASLLYILVASLAMKLPLFLLWPVMMIALPISGIAGVVYAIQHNRHGGRMRLFDKDDEHEEEKKRLKSGD